MVQARSIDNCRPMFPGRFLGRFVSARQNLHKSLSEWSHRFCYSSPDCARKMAEMMLRIAILYLSSAFESFAKCHSVGVL